MASDALTGVPGNRNLAISAIVVSGLSHLCLFFVGGVAGAILGFLALDRRRRDGFGYFKLPIAAIVLGAMNVIACAVAIVATWYSIAGSTVR